ncbi:class I SAM-dependent methyltransferase [Lysobacter solisilvae (ex Woo and Kim 2020)]|uniref:Class I SAM-dependent methyltransferase n=1 Tax=Agrilutibacter terrestris TaxID=2865112 RepID=A0A7H0G091_9GAMM|nr:class I SAM-dependent methyltransferase [Lysobacter terrestris]QNP41707.1 class I SAM-dependent methyltransferase [Lysobacter terrestris]
MRPPASDALFGGSLPELYERHLVPLIFQAYAVDLAARTAALAPHRVLEIAAGTGVVTRALAARLGRDVDIVATDLNAPMLQYAARIGTARPVQWQPADAQHLPFADAEFDAVACQFGVMFFPDKPQAFAQARRVLRPGGTLLFNVWDRIGENVFADTVTTALADVFPDDPPRFLARTPHGYFDTATIARDLARGGFTQPPRIDTVTLLARADHPRTVAVAYCEGTPLRNEIEARDTSRLAAATAAAETALARRFGSGAIEGRIQAHVVEVRRTE